jgi:hypothetical protein
MVRAILAGTKTQTRRVLPSDYRDEEFLGATWAQRPRDGAWAPCRDELCNDALGRVAFQFGWDSINGKRAPWSSNPWVWVITVRRLA